MKTTLHKISYDIAYIFAIVAYCIIVPVFIVVAAVLYVVWWIYEPIAKVLKGE